MFGKETPSTIFAWNQETFNNSADRVANRAYLEVAELFLAALNDDAEGVVSELADVAIMLWAVAAANNVEVSLKPSKIQICQNDEERTQLTKTYSRFLCIDYSTYLFYLSEIKLLESIGYLNNIAYTWNIHLPNIVDDKMIINRNRNWKRVGKDNFQHT